MTESEEQIYLRGERAIWRRLLGECIKALGQEDGDKNRWILEREDTVAMLRTVCADHGDNEWADDLHLADVIDKHLYNHLES